jgi:TRAP-type mannitol/chloroaromatic compound transport system substrate-binding protein
MGKMKFLLGLLIIFSLAVPVFSVNAETFMMETPLPLNLRDISDPEVYQPFLDDLKLVAKLKVTFGGTNPNTFNDVGDGTLMFGTGLTNQSGIPAMELYYGMPFGMEGQEFISWLYEGGGLELAREIYASRGVVPIPFRVTVAEGGGWFLNELSMSYLTSGDVRMRFFGFGGEVLRRAFPDVETPPSTAGVSLLEDFKSGNFNALEFSLPILDKQQFFDIPGPGNTIKDAGASHYYIGSWWQPYTYSEVWINKDFYDGLKQDVRDKIDLVSRAHVLRSLAETNEGQGAAVKYFADQGVTVHFAWPNEIREELRNATIQLINERSNTDPEWMAVVESMKAFVRNEQTRWSEANEERGDRFEGANWSGWDSIIP